MAPRESSQTDGRALHRLAFSCLSDTLLPFFGGLILSPSRIAPVCRLGVQGRPPCGLFIFSGILVMTRQMCHGLGMDPTPNLQYTHVFHVY